MTDITAAQVPGYIAGKWTIDPAHSEVGFSVRHMMVSKVRGRFTEVAGEIVTADDPAQSTVTAEIKTASFTTDNEQRDNHIRSSDFLEVQTWPEMTYASTGIRQQDGEFILDGKLTLKGVTRDVPLTLEVNGFGPDAYGGTRAGFTATGEINRGDFNVSFNAPLQNGGVVVADRVQLHLEVEAVLVP
jgi:polyisoprenoid-binding protein YceI